MTTKAPTPFDQPSTIAKTSDDPEGGDGAYTFDGKPDQWKRYRLPDPVTGKAQGYTRSTTFAKTISDTYRLNLWRTRQAIDGMILRPDLQMKYATESDNEKKNKIADEAANAAGAKVGANLGTALHAFSEAVDRGEDPMIPAPFRPHIAAWTALVEQFNLEILDIERVILCTDPAFDIKGVAGTLDRIVRFKKDTTVELPGGGTHTFKKGTIAILDLKTGKDLSYGWLEITVQLATYANAGIRFDKEKKEWIDMPKPMDLDVALVVHLPATAPGETVKATMYAVDIATGYEMAQLCTDVRQARKKKGLATALAVVEEKGVVELPGVTVDPSIPDNELHVIGATTQVIKMDPEAVPLRPPTLTERAQQALTESDLQTIWFEAVRARKDTKALADEIRARRKTILAESAAG
jgi:hypothetical protein